MSHRPTVVMIPGTLCDGRLFQRQQRALRGLADVRVIDYHGLRRGRNWAQALLRELPERFSVVGFSLGGLWALELLRLAPERVERLAMVASNAQGASAAARRKGAWLRRAWQSRGAATVVARLAPDYFHHPVQLQRHLALVRAMALQTPARVAYAQFAWAAERPSGHEALARFQGPALIVSGANDRLCPRHMQERMARTLPAAQWIELPRVGHFVPLEAGAVLSDALRRWIAA